MGDTGFKHISVTAAEEDDFVIRAGMAEPSEDVEEPATEPEDQSEPQLDDAQEQAEKADAKPSFEESRSSAQTRHQATGANQPKANDDLTLEDLETAPMPLAQKVVIIAAIVCIIGAVIYYFAFMS